MSKWMWALGYVPGTSKFRWAVNAGDQLPHSEDDQECGDHFIDKGLECHDGDAHRPTPGKNPYYQGGREGPEDKSKDTGKRDRSEVTPQTKKRKEGQEQKEGYGPVNFAEERFDHYSGMLEQAWEKKTGKPLEWNDKRIGEMTEMVMRDTAREFSLDADDLGFQDSGVDYYGPEDNPLEPFRGEPKKGYKGRALWRPRSHEKETTTPREGGGKEQVPPGLRSEMGQGLYQKIQELKGKERKGEERTESALASDMNWSGSKIMMDRAEQPIIPGCPPEKDLLELDSALPNLPGGLVKGRALLSGYSSPFWIIPGDEIVGRPCGEEVELNWETQPALAEQLQWTEARPCTDGDEDSEYGPHGDDQKCVDEGGGYEDLDEPSLDPEGWPNMPDEEREGWRDEPSDVPEGYQEVDMGDPSDPEGEDGDWESLLDEDADEIDMKRTLKEEEQQKKQEKQEILKEEKVNKRTATRVPRDPNLGPDNYHQFWNRDDWHIERAREILEQRIANPKTLEDAEAAKSLLMNGPRVGGGYEKAGRLLPGEPSKEDFLGVERDRDPII